MDWFQDPVVLPHRQTRSVTLDSIINLKEFRCFSANSPAMQPGNRESSSKAKVSGDIQLPIIGSTPSGV